MYHYVYKLEHIETGEFYIGSRSSKKHPTLDPYLGSMKTWKPEKNKLKKYILSDIFKDRESAILFESEEISKNIKNILNRNYHIPSTGFHTFGTVTTKDSNGNTFQVSTDDPRYLSGELVGVSKGKIPVRDKNGNTFQVSTDDPRYLSGDLTHITIGLLNVKDENENILKVSIDDPRYLSGDLKPIWIGKKHTQDAKDKMSKSSKGKGMNDSNSQYGTCWITLCGENKKIKKDQLNDYLEIGWLKGRVIKNKIN
jgi:hypothetical protein